ncbi:hypothetical protein ACTX1M_30225 [Pseudomonas aeruginosa]|uniref:hypothetical protein n=1 Tax=Pseudomonas aeruginosa TaxID=287 RepID=UPI0015F01279|nr:hypothetical protein [Pseudomonas aeruginosa]
MNKANECTCPSGDGSLVHPCPAHPAVEQAGGDERAADAKPCATRCPDCGEHDLMPGDLCACGYETDPATGYACSECDGSGEGCVGEVCRECDGSGWFVTPDQASAALAQPSPVLPPFAEKVLAKLRRFYDCASDFESGGVDIGRRWLDLLTQLGLLNRIQRSPALWEISQQGEDLLGAPQHFPAQAEADRPEVAEVAFVLRNIGAMDAEDIDGDNVDLRFEDAEGRDTGCDVSIVEYAEKAADLFEQHDRIVGALRADRDSWAEQAEQRLADWDEMRKERDAALARVAELEALMQMNFGELHTARNLLSRLSVSGVNVDAILGGQLQDLVIVPADATLEMVEALKRSLTVTNRGTLLNAGHALNASIAASPFAKKAPEPVMCPRCEGEGTLRTGIDESPSTICKRCDGVGTIAAAPGKEVPQAWLDVQAERRRQITAEGWTPEHDDLYCAAELPRAAAAYILNGANDEAPAIWSFSAKWWKPRDARSNYVRAGALILAEIERLDRAAPGKEGA